MVLCVLFVAWNKLSADCLLIVWVLLFKTKIKGEKFTKVRRIGLLLGQMSALSRSHLELNFVLLNLMSLNLAIIISNL